MPAQLTPRDLELLLGCACFNVRAAARAVTGYYDRVLAPSGLKITQFAMLTAVKAAGAISMQRLAAHLNLDPSTLTRTLQPLEKDGLLRIEEAGDDRRMREVVLTAAGHHRVDEAHRLWAQAQDGLRDRLGAERFERLVRDLGALARAAAEG